MNSPQPQALPGSGATTPPRATAAPASQAPPRPQRPKTAPRGPPLKIVFVVGGLQGDQPLSDAQLQQALAEAQKTPTPPTPPTSPSPPPRRREPPPAISADGRGVPSMIKTAQRASPSRTMDSPVSCPFDAGTRTPTNIFLQVPASPTAPLTPVQGPPATAFPQVPASPTAPLTPSKGPPATMFPQVPTYPSALPYLTVAFEQAPPALLLLSARPLFTPKWCPPGFDPARFEFQEALTELLAFSRNDRLTSLHLAGLYLQHVWDPTLFPVGRRIWQRDVKKDDLLERFPGAAAIRPAPEPGTPLEAMVGKLGNSDFGHAVLQHAIYQWSLEAPIREVKEVMNLASWRIPDLDPDVITIEKIKNMAEGPEKQALLAEAEARSPGFFKKCMEDPLCGIKRKPDQASNYAPEPKRRCSQERTGGPVTTYRQVYGQAVGQASPNFKQQFLAEQRQKKVLQEEKRRARLALLQATREEQPAQTAYDPKAWVKGANFTHFPDVKRTKLAPAKCMPLPKMHTAFDTFFGDPGIIPRDENMEPDPSRMNCWWRALYTIDQATGSNFCWLKD